MPRMILRHEFELIRFLPGYVTSLANFFAIAAPMPFNEPDKSPLFLRPQCTSREFLGDLPIQTGIYIID